MARDAAGRGLDDACFIAVFSLPDTDWGLRSSAQSVRHQDAEQAKSFYPRAWSRVAIYGARRNSRVHGAGA
jgi:hypothetical protein